MKVLFAVNNDKISEAIIKKYQKDYKEILSYKNVYYFNAIIKELQKDKGYDRVVISEDLEPFANNNYDTIDKFLFDRLDSISDEATDAQGNDTEIILICNDRRAKADEILVKYFGIGIYSALIGQDRKIDEVCKLINKPRSKREAKQYYKVEADSVNYQSEDENNVSEVEVQNILAHYKRLGKDEDKYVDSFNNIVSQYNDNQLRIIISCLPIGVKAVLEARSPKYQELMTYSFKGKNAPNLGTTGKDLNKQDKPPIDVRMLDKGKTKIAKPVIIPSGVNKQGVKKLIKETPKIASMEEEKVVSENIEGQKEVNKSLDIDAMLDEIPDVDESVQTAPQVEETVKKGRGRPKKAVPVELEQIDKTKRGKSKKDQIPEEIESINDNQEDEEIDLFGLGEETQVEPKTIKHEEKQDEGIDLFGLDDEETQNEPEPINYEEKQDEGIDLFGLDDEETQDEPEPINYEEKQDEGIDLFGLDDEETQDNSEPINYETKKEEQQDKNFDLFDLDNEEKESEDDFINNEIISTNISPVSSEYNALLSKDKKVITFVGTTKNGTSFVVNNLAELLASMGIPTAVLDLTKSRNAYYIYTNNEERLRKQAEVSIEKLRSGIADGIKVNKNLSIYTALPMESIDYSNAESILSTLVKNYSVVLIDCDFDTPIEYFEKAQEIFLVQSMDVLTIQPLTAFLRNLKSKGILRQEKIKIVINKFEKVRSLSAKTLIGGIAFYNDPGMSYMTELFNKDIVPYCVIPFETQNYVKYLEYLATCSISLNGYTKTLIDALKDLANLAYPLVNKQTYSPRGPRYQDNFSQEMNNTLNKMKKYQ